MQGQSPQGRSNRRHAAQQVSSTACLVVAVVLVLVRVLVVNVIVVVNIIVVVNVIVIVIVIVLVQKLFSVLCETGGRRTVHVRQPRRQHGATAGRR